MKLLLDAAVLQDILSGLTDEQADAVLSYDGGPMRISAIPGSGKTHTMIRLFVKLWLALNKRMLQGNSRVRAVTFTRKACGEMIERASGMLDGHNPARAISTFHSLALRIIRDNEVFASRVWCRNPRPCDIKDCKDIIMKALDHEFGPDSDVSMKDLIDLWAQTSSECGGLDEFEIELCAMDTPLYEGLANASLWIISRLKKRRMIPMMLMVPVAVDIMRMRRHGICDVAIIDEFQDTDKSQLILSKEIVKPSDNLVVVGDVHQSIYSWRGAIPENMGPNFDALFDKVTDKALTLNFRSTNKILTAGEEVLSVAYPGKSVPHLGAREIPGEHVELVSPNDNKEEASVLVDYIKECLAKGYTLSDIGVLYRTNSSAREIEATLIRAGISVRVVKSIDFISRAEVKDFIAYWKWMVDPDSMDAATRVVNKPSIKIGKKSIERMDLNYVTATGWPKRAQEKQQFMQALNLRYNTEGIAPNLLAQSIIFDSGLFNMYDGQEESGVTRQENMITIMDWMNSCTEDGLTADEAFDELFLSVAAPEPDIPTVTLMTMHSSKGLEFPCVFIANAVEGVIPSAFGGNVKEACHLFYVAVTRAKDRLLISAPKTRMIYRKGSPPQVTDCFPTRFTQMMTKDAKSDKRYAIFHWDKKRETPNLPIFMTR